MNDLNVLLLLLLPFKLDKIIYNTTQMVYNVKEACLGNPSDNVYNQAIRKARCAVGS